MWIKRGEEKEIRTNTGRCRINFNGAMNIHQPEEVEIVEAETINAPATEALLEKLSDKHRDKEIYVFADNARYYHNAAVQDWLVRNPRVHLLHPPLYSPNLNLIERLWKVLRKKIINLHHYPKFEEFRKAVLVFFENLKQYKNELRTLMRPNFQRFSTSPKTQTAFS